MKARPWPFPRVLAHRGGGALAPENTLAAIRTGLAHGYRAVEFDAMLPADGTPILMHDPTLNRTARVAGNVAEWSSTQLHQLDVGSWHSPQFAGEPIPTLAAALALCRRHGIWPNVEIKPAPGRDGPTGAAVARETARSYADILVPGNEPADGVDPRLPLLSSFSREALLTAREAVPELPRGWLVDQVPRPWHVEIEALGCVSLHTNQEYLSPELARSVKAAGVWLFCYTVNEPERARELLGWGVDAFCTDRIDLIGAEIASG